MDLSDFWVAPGPRTFRKDVVGDLLDLRSVIVIFPELQPGGFVDSVRKEIQASERLFWYSLDIPGDDLCPGAAMSHWLPELSDNIPEASLARCFSGMESIRGRCLFADVRQTTHWKRWTEFLDVFESIMSRTDPHERAVFFVLPPPNNIGSNRDVSRSCLAIYNWSASCRRDDIAFTLWLKHGDHISRKVSETRLRISIASSLAQWDPQLADLLVFLSLDDLNTPGPCLQKYGEQQGWRNWLGSCPSRLVQLGASMEIDGETNKHSAWLQLEGATSSVNRRLWRGQMHELLPFAEEMRMEIIDRYRSILRPPVPSAKDFVTTACVEDLSYGQIAYQFAARRWNGVPRGFTDYFNWLKIVRNKLAHCVPLSSVEIWRYIQSRSD